MPKIQTDVPRITGLLVIEVRKSNPNGDPERESSPRQRPDGRGEISPVSYKRKLRDLVAAKDGPVWEELAKQFTPALEEKSFQIIESRGRDRGEIIAEMQRNEFIDKYWDARLFGSTFLESRQNVEKDLERKLSDKEWEELQKYVRSGAAHFGVGISVAPIEIEFSTWTNKSGVETGKDRGMAPMAFRVVKHGLYTMPFFVNPSQAHKTGCKKRDVELMLQLLRYAYPHTMSVIRTMVEVRHAHVFTHKSALGSVSDFALIDALTPKHIEGDTYAIPTWDEIKAPFTAKGEYRDYAV